VGAGLMYVFDPDQGRRRRALVRDQMTGMAHEACDAAQSVQRDLANRARPEIARQYVLRQEEDQAPPNGESRGETPAYATVIAESPADIHVLSVGEAVMRMDLADQQVLMFRNSGTDELNVIYRRSDGNIGWIDPSASK